MTLVLSGPNKFTGGTTVNNGILSLANLVPGTSASTPNNSALGSGMVTVNAGGTLATGGFTAATGFSGNTAPVVVTSGLITGPLQVNSGGTVTPGNGAAGSLYVGSLNASAGSIFNFAINSPVAGNYSTLVSAGAITLDPSGAETINITGSKLAVGTFTLVTGTSITGNNFVEGTTPAGPNRTYTLTSNGSSEILTVVNTGTERDFSTTGTTPLTDGSGTFGQGATNFVQSTNGVTTNNATYNNADNSDAAFGNGGAGGQITILSGGARVGGVLILGSLQSGSMYTFGAPASTNAITTVGGLFASNSALINAPVILGGSQTYSIGTGNTVAFTGGISESVTGSQLTLTGNGTLALNGGTGSWTGGTNISGGALQTTTAALPATGGIIDGASLVFDQVNSGTTGTYAGLISGPGTVTVQDTGTVTLTNAANTYTGQTILTGGTLAVANVGSLGTGDGGIVLAGGTLQANANLSFPLNNGAAGAVSRKLTLSAGTTSTVNAGGFAVTFGQNITGAGNLIVTGGGSVTLTGVPSTTVIGTVGVGANTNFVIAPPSLIPSFGFSFANTPGTVAGNIVVADPIELRLFGGDMNGGGNIVLQPTGMLVVARANTTIDGGSGIVLNALNASGASESIGSANGFTFTINGVISGNSAVDFTTGNNTSSVTLGANNTYTGATTIDQPVTLGTNNALPPATDITMTGTGLFELNGYNQSVNSLSSTKTGSIVQNTAQTNGAVSTLTITGSLSTTFQGTLQDLTDNTGSGVLGLTLNGTGSLALTNVSSYSGPLNILDGRLQITIADPSAGTGLGAASVINIGTGSNGSNAQLDFSGVGNASSQATISYITPTQPFATAPVINLNGMGGYNTGTGINAGAIRVSGASNLVIPDNIVFNNNSSIAVTGQSLLMLSGNLSGPGTFFSEGNGLVTLTGSNPGYTGGTQIDAGTFNVAAGSVMGSGPLTVNNIINSVAGSSGTAVTVNFLNGGQTVGTLSGSITQPTTGTNTAAIVLPTGTTLTVNQTADATYAGTITGPGSLIKTGPNILSIGGAETYTGTTNVSTGTLVIGTNPSPGVFNMISAGITVGSGAKLALANNSTQTTRTLLTTPTVSLASTGTLDLGNNDLVVTSGSLSTLTAEVAQGYNLTHGGNWNGTGITSSAAAANSSHLTALGIIQNNQDGSAVYPTTFDDTAVGASNVLIKYTYFGDANLDGKVDGSDYSLIDAGYVSNKAGFVGTRLTGWLNGDFNYDGVIDGSDYALIDNAFNNQGSSLTPNALVASATAQVAGPVATAVPEPATAALAVAACGFLAARRRRAK